MISQITKNLPGFGMEVDKNEVLDTLMLADPEYFRNKPIDILIGGRYLRGNFIKWFNKRCIWNANGPTNGYYRAKHQ